MATAKTSGNTTANPIEDATKKLAELNEEAAQKLAAFAEHTTKQLTELAEQAKAAQKQQSLAAIDAYEQAVMALADSFEQAASRAAQGRGPQPRRRHARVHHRLHHRGTPAALGGVRHATAPSTRRPSERGGRAPRRRTSGRCPSRASWAAG